MNNINKNYKNSLNQFYNNNNNYYKSKYIKFISLKHSLKKNKPNNLIYNNNNKIKNILLNFSNENNSNDNSNRLFSPILFRETNYTTSSNISLKKIFNKTQNSKNSYKIIKTDLNLNDKINFISINDSNKNINQINNKINKNLNFLSCSNFKHLKIKLNKKTNSKEENDFERLLRNKQFEYNKNKRERELFKLDYRKFLIKKDVKIYNNKIEKNKGIFTKFDKISDETRLIKVIFDYVNTYVDRTKIKKLQIIKQQRLKRLEYLKNLELMKKLNNKNCIQKNEIYNNKNLDLNEQILSDIKSKRNKSSLIKQINKNEFNFN